MPGIESSGAGSAGGSPAAASLGTYQLTDLARQPWRPTGSIAENVIRMLCSTNVALTSGQLDLYGGLLIPQGKTVNSITFVSGGTAAVTPTNQFFVLADTAVTVLGKTADDTTTAWGANTAKTLTLATPYVASADIAVYCGIVVVAATPPSLAGSPSTGNNMGLVTPRMAQHAQTGLTNPASLTTITPGAQINQLAYCYVS